MTNVNILEKDKSHEPVNVTQCGESNGYAHHWIIDDRNLGVCKKCGDRRQFPNVWLGQTISCDWKEQIVDKAYATWTSDKKEMTEE